jgi:outer membrane protein OmpA-like peptidoglycan-associated protein
MTTHPQNNLKALIAMNSRNVLRVLTVLLSCSAGALTPVQGSSPDRIGNVDFTYQVLGDPAARPLQVFDDGKVTYFQFRSGESIPAIFAEVDGNLGLQLSRAEGPYVTVPVVARRYLLRLGSRIARVSYMGGQPLASSQLPSSADPTSGAPRLIAAAALPQGLPRDMFVDPPRIALDASSYATPVKGDRTEWVEDLPAQEHSIVFRVGVARLDPAGVKVARTIAASLSGASRIEVVGRDDGSFKEGLAEARAAAVVDLLVAAGVPRERIALKRSPTLKTGSEKGTVVGATVIAMSTRKAELAAAPAVGRREASDAIVARLQARQITPAEALQQLEMVARGGQKAPSPVPVRAPSRWEMRKADATLESLLRRWGKDSGWSVVLDGAPEIRITADQEVKEIDGVDFVKAADFVISGARKQGFKIKGAAYANNVLVLTEDKSK